MKFEIGDKVKFIDEVGGGIVIKLNSPISVTVQTEDGFEIPTMTKNLLKIEAKTAEEKIFVEAHLNNSSKLDISKNVDKRLEDNSHIDALIGANAGLSLLDQHLSLAFIPRDQTWFITGGLGVYMVNYSKRSVYFQYVNAESHCIHGLVPPFTRFHLIEISREEIDLYSHGFVQIMVLSNAVDDTYFPSSLDFKIKGQKFYTEGSYVKNPIFHEKSILHRLTDFSLLPKLEIDQPHRKRIEKSDNVEVKVAVKQPERNDEILMFKKSDDYAVVDMHIWEIVDDHSFMTSEQMLNHQLSYFQKCLNSALEHNIKRVVFIHGVGSGRLKDEIRAQLDVYPFISYKSASMQEFGVGATEIEISVNR